jgi:hypothetical protein
VLFTVSATLANNIIKESRSSIRMDDSARAYSAAESGIEWAKHYTNNMVGTSNFNEVGCPSSQSEIGKIHGPFSIEDEGGSNGGEPAKYQVVLAADGPSNCIISSLGTSNDTNRKLEYTITSSGLDEIPFDLNSILAVKGSYVQQFSIWRGNVVNTSGSIDVGLKNDSGDKYIAMGYESNASEINIWLASDGDVKSDKISIPSKDLDNPYALHIKIEYLRGTAIRLSVRKRDKDGYITCISPDSTAHISASGKNYSSLNHFMLSSNIPGVTVGLKPADQSIGDGDVMSIFSSSGQYLYIDNMAAKGIIKKP